MRLAHLIVVVALAGGNWAFGQGGFIVHLNDLQEGRNGAAFAVREVPDGYLVFCDQFSQEFTGRTHIYVRGLDAIGELQSDHQYRVGDDEDFDIGYIDAIATNADGTFTAAIAEGYGYLGETWLYRFNSTGDTISRHFVMSFEPADSIVHILKQVRELGDGGFALVGGFDPIDLPTRGFVVRVGVDGDTLWTRRFGSATEGVVVLGVAEYDGAGLLLTGYGGAPGNPNKSFLIRTDSNGNQVWRRNYGDDATVNGAVRVAADGGIITWSEYREPTWPSFYWQQMMLTKWNDNGGIVWQKRSHYNNYVNTHDFEILPDGSMIATGTSALEAVLAKFSSTGDSIWSRSYAPTHGGSYLLDVQPTSDGGFVATGETRRYDPIDTAFQTNQVIWVLKTDSLGCVVPGCQNVGVQEYALDMDEHLQVWPNPVSDWLNITFEPPTEFTPQGALRITVQDALGKVVLQEVFTSRPIDVQHLSAGTYHVHLSDEKRWLAGKTIVKE